MENSGGKTEGSVYPRLLPQLGEEIESFLARVIPTQCVSSPFVQIGRQSSKADERVATGASKPTKPAEMRSYYAGQKAVRDLIAKPKESLTLEAIDNAAKSSNTRSGKWKIQLHKDIVDERFATIARWLWSNEGKDGAITSVKVSTKLTQERKGRGDRHTMYVYTKDYLNEEDVMAAREILRKLGYLDELEYKPDIYTTLRIPHEGTPQVPPYRYKK